MANPTYEPKITALLCVDFYNDFLSEGGKLWPWVKEIAEQVKLLDNLHTIVRTAREAGITVFHVPHHRMEPDTYKDWKYPAPISFQAWPRARFSPRGPGAGRSTMNSRCSPVISSRPSTGHPSGFPNTDLDHQLKRHGKEKDHLHRPAGKPHVLLRRRPASAHGAAGYHRDVRA